MDVYMALSTPIRRSILELLAELGQQNATDIAKHFNITASAISQHLKILREAHLVVMERKAQQRIYGINPTAISEVADWANAIDARHSRLDVVLQAMKVK